MAEFKVSPQTLQQKAEELRGMNSRLQTAIDSLQQYESTLNGQWEGDAHDSFHREFTNDVKKLLNFHTAIEEYVQRLNEIAESYINAEQKNINVANVRSM